MTRKSKNPINSPEKLVRANPSTTTVREYFGPYNNQTDGLRIGIEVEVETENDQYPRRERVLSESTLWEPVADGSLRNAAGTGRGGMEYITQGSIPFDRAEEALTELGKFLRSARSKVRRSNRTSVHVHCNVQHLTLTQLMTLLCCYYITEPILCRFNGFERENNLFCMQALNSPTLIDNLLHFLRHRRFEEGCKYSALNPAPLSQGRLGTIEFRAGQGIAKDPIEALPWIKLIESLFSSAERFENPTQVVEQLSLYGTLPFIERNMPEIYREGQRLFEEYELEYSCAEAMRNCQPLAYDIDWGDYTPQQQTSKVSGPAVDPSMNRPIAELEAMFHDEAVSPAGFRAAMERARIPLRPATTTPPRRAAMERARIPLRPATTTHPRPTWNWD